MSGSCSRSNSSSSCSNTSVNEAGGNRAVYVLGVFFGVGCLFGANGDGCPMLLAMVLS